MAGASGFLRNGTVNAWKPGGVTTEAQYSETTPLRVSLAERSPNYKENREKSEFILQEI